MLTIAEHIKRIDRSASRDLTAGIIGLTAAATMVLITLRLQDYCSPALIMVSLFIFPVPVACGLAVGLVSPKNAIVWAPVWALIFTVLLFTMLHGGIRDAQVALSPWRMAFMTAGAALAAAAGLAGQYISLKGWTVRAVMGFLGLCCVMGLCKYALIAQQMRDFRHNIAPEVLLDVDADYIRLPRGLAWTCERMPGLESYRLSTSLRGTPLRVTVNARTSRIMGVSHEIKGDRQLSSTAEVRAYLNGLGFREPILRSLSKQKGVADQWCASLDSTRLTVDSTGHVSVQGLSESLQ